MNVVPALHLFVKFIKEEFNSENLVEALNKHKCPAVITIDTLAKPIIPTVMVAIGVEIRTDSHAIVTKSMSSRTLIKCKNTYSNDEDVFFIPVKQFPMKDFNEHSRRFPRSKCAFYISVKI